MFLLNDSTHRMLFRHHPRLGHLWIPHLTARIPHEGGGYLVHTNGQGFRSDVEFSPEKGDRPRILFFGDSMTAGDGCSNSERFPEMIGEMLGAEVYNYGLSGSGTDQQLLILEDLARGIQADLVVLCVYVENIARIKAAFRPTLDRLTRREVLAPKPYFVLEDGSLRLCNVPVPLPRPAAEAPEWSAVHRQASLRQNLPGLGWAYNLADKLRKSGRLAGLLKPLLSTDSSDFTPLRALPYRLSGFDPVPDYQDHDSPGCRLMRAICERFFAAAAPCPVLLVPVPMYYHFLHKLPARFQGFFAGLANDRVHVADLASFLRGLPLTKRRRLTFARDAHFSPFGHGRIAELLAAEIRSRGLLPARPAAPTRPRAADGPRRSEYILGLSCFYHNSAACLIKDGRIVAAAEEERFSRVKHDPRFPAAAVNYCLEEAGIPMAEVKAVAYYDNPQLTIERLLRSAAAGGRQARGLWLRAMPAWVGYKLNLPDLIRGLLRYEGPVLQDLHHRSHAASAFFPSPFRRAAILTVDGVGEWSTATIASGSDGGIDMLKEMRFPHSLGLLYSAFTQFTGFKVNSGEYKLMGLAPYGSPMYAAKILEELVDLKPDGSLELNMEYFAFLWEPAMTNARFAELFGGPARRPESPITRREMDIAASIQRVTEEAVLRMAREARRLTGDSRLCLAGGVALNCVANGRLLREGPFEEIWIQPAAGDAGAALGAALDAHHIHFGAPRQVEPNARSPQGGSYLGPGYSRPEIEAFLESYGYPFRALADSERAEAIAAELAQGKVVGHFSGRSEFGPRALGNRSILGDPRNPEMQATLNLKIKFRESFRPFAPTVLRERVAEFFELDADSPYMLLVAPVRPERRLPFRKDPAADVLDLVRIPRSDIPAVTHVDYSARIQTLVREDNPDYYDLIAAFDRRTGCPVVVNTSFNVRGEPIVNTPREAYRCFMRTNMDVLVLGHCILHKEDQPPFPEEPPADPAPNPGPATRLSVRLAAVFDRIFLPRVALHSAGSPTPFPLPFRQSPTLWVDFAGAATSKDVFRFPEPLAEGWKDCRALAAAVVGQWTDPVFARAMLPVVESLLDISRDHAVRGPSVETVPESIYAMF